MQTVPTETRSTDLRVKDAVGLYARRKARMFFLRASIVAQSHPVLDAELCLVEMARAKLLEAFLSSDPGFMSSHAARSAAEEDLKSEMRRNAARITSDPGLRSQILSDVEDESLDVILIPRDRPA